MSTKEKLLRKILSGTKNISFAEIKKLLEAFGFNLERISGSHHLFFHAKLKELVNIQNVKGQVKPYQIKQILKLIEKYGLKIK